jgi:2'-5' RNA ligase
MRLFVAIEIDDAARAAIAAEQRRLARAMGDGAGSLRFVHAEQLHLTLVFLGELGEPAAQAVVAAMALDIDRAPYSITFGGVGVFPPRGAPRVVWLGLMEGGAETVLLHDAVQSRLEGAGAPRDPRPFSPHLTLARWRDGRRRERGAVRESRERLATVRVERVTLFESRLSSGGPAYTALAHARLTCR